MVIDNGSTDGTAAYLESNNINYVSQENSGSAGGWYRGIEYALVNNFDAVWLMDDDGFPHCSALEVLEANLTEGISCVSSIVLREDSSRKFVFPFPKVRRDGSYLSFCYNKITTVKKLKKYSKTKTYPFAHLFNGALISIDAIKKVGNINKKFYIYGEEVDYFYRLKKYGPVLSVFDAFHFHPDVTKRPFTSNKVYYYARNSLILNKFYHEYVFMRNFFVIILIILRIFQRNRFFDALSYVFGKKILILYRAISNGIKQDIGEKL